VLGIAIHFQMSFVDSSAECAFPLSIFGQRRVELTAPALTVTYVSLAVFVSAVTLALFVVVYVFFPLPPSHQSQCPKARLSGTALTKGSTLFITAFG
jgi:hypothetical protein